MTDSTKDQLIVKLIVKLEGRVRSLQDEIRVFKEKARLGAEKIQALKTERRDLTLVKRELEKGLGHAQERIRDLESK